MGRTPAIGILKSKFLTVLGNSNELLNGISSKVSVRVSKKLLILFFDTRYYFDYFPFRLIGYLLELLTYVSVYSGTWCILWKP